MSDASPSTSPPPPPPLASEEEETRPSYDASERYARIPGVPRRIHILGTGSVGKLVAHSLRGIPNPPPITLIFHRYRLLHAWRESKQEIVIESDGYKVPRSGFEVELAVGVSRSHGAPDDGREESDTRTTLQPRLPEHPREAETETETETEAEADAQSNQVDDVDERQLRQSAPDAPPSDEPIHNLIVTVKAPHTISAIRPIKHRLLPTSTICFIQNGMGTIDDVNRALFPDPATRPNYMQGILNHGVNQASVTDPFTAIHAGHGTLALGILPREEDSLSLQDSVPFSPNARYLLRTLTRTPVLAAVGVPPIDLIQLQLEKLAVNSVINPLTVLLDAPNGSILYNYAITRSMRLILAEVSLVLRSLPELRGLPNAHARFAPDRLESLVVNVANVTANNISSMLADVRAGRQTEARWISGYVVRRGEQLGLQCVCNYMMQQLVDGKTKMVENEADAQVRVEKPDLSGER
ncbi:hypothetical protein AAFC00_004110 [Neodothiora populina]